MKLLIGGALALVFLPLPWALTAIGGLGIWELLELAVWLHGRGRRPQAGQESLVGEHGILADGGRVRIRGTTYRAVVLDGEVGDRVRVEEVDGLTLVVRRHEPVYEEPEAR
jgi:membrane protein implicated in regulation of membrane protease activity